MSDLFIRPDAKKEWEKLKDEWGEVGPSHNVAHPPVTTLNRTAITLNAKGFIPVNSTERQKKRTFVDTP